MRFKLGYFLKQAFHGVFRNAVVSTASVLMLVLCMLVLGCFWTILENIDLNISSIDGLNMIVVYLEDDADQLAVNNELNRLPGEPTITYYSKDDNLEKLKETYEEQGFGDLLSFYDSENNPLPASFEITFSDVEKGSARSYYCFIVAARDTVRRSFLCYSDYDKADHLLTKQRDHRYEVYRCHQPVYHNAFFDRGCYYWACVCCSGVWSAVFSVQLRHAGFSQPI